MKAYPLATFNLIPPAFRESTYIAGGFAAQSAMAKDIDLWICVPDEQIRRLTGLMNLPEIQPWAAEYPLRERVTPLGTAMHYDTTVQLFAYDGDVVGLLSEFDISTHAVAINFQGVPYYAPTFTPIDQQPRVQRFTTPYTTLRRYFMICERYGHRPNWNDVCRLATEIVRDKAKWDKLKGYKPSPEDLVDDEEALRRYDTWEEHNA